MVPSRRLQKLVFPNYEQCEENCDVQKGNFQVQLGLTGWRTDHLDHPWRNSNVLGGT